MVLGSHHAWQSQTSKQYQQHCQSPEPYYRHLQSSQRSRRAHNIIKKVVLSVPVLLFWACTNFLEQNSTIMKTFFFELAGLTQLVPLQAPERRARNSKPARLPSQFSQDFRR